MSGTTPIPADDLRTTFGANPDIERLYDHVQAILPGVTLSLLQMMAWGAIEEFAIRSTYFREQVSWSMAIGVSTVNFNPHSADMQVCWVLGQDGLWQWQVNPPGELVDLRTPTTARTGTALLALKPTSFDANLPNEMWTNWFETILDGTLFRLFGMPGKPWASPQLAQYHGARFRQGINRARDVATRNWSNQQAPWTFPYFAAGRRKR
jgi:hypothetical protein